MGEITIRQPQRCSSRHSLLVREPCWTCPKSEYSALLCWLGFAEVYSCSGNRNVLSRSEEEGSTRTGISDSLKISTPRCLRTGTPTYTVVALSVVRSVTTLVYNA